MDLFYDAVFAKYLDGFYRDWRGSAWADILEECRHWCGERAKKVGCSCSPGGSSSVAAAPGAADDFKSFKLKQWKKQLLERKDFCQPELDEQWQTHPPKFLVSTRAMDDAYDFNEEEGVGPVLQVVDEEPPGYSRLHYPEGGSSSLTIQLHDGEEAYSLAPLKIPYMWLLGLPDHAKTVDAGGRRMQGDWGVAGARQFDRKKITPSKIDIEEGVCVLLKYRSFGSDGEAKQWCSWCSDRYKTRWWSTSRRLARWHDDLLISSFTPVQRARSTSRRLARWHSPFIIYSCPTSPEPDGILSSRGWSVKGLPLVPYPARAGASYMLFLKAGPTISPLLPRRCNAVTKAHPAPVEDEVAPDSPAPVAPVYSFFSCSGWIPFPRRRENRETGKRQFVDTEINADNLLQRDGQKQEQHTTWFWPRHPVVKINDVAHELKPSSNRFGAAVKEVLGQKVLGKMHFKTEELWFHAGATNADPPPADLVGSRCEMPTATFFEHKNVPDQYWKSLDQKSRDFSEMFSQGGGGTGSQKNPQKQPGSPGIPWLSHYITEKGEVMGEDELTELAQRSTQNPFFVEKTALLLADKEAVEQAKNTLKTLETSTATVLSMQGAFERHFLLEKLKDATSKVKKVYLRG